MNPSGSRDDPIESRGLVRKSVPRRLWEKHRAWRASRAAVEKAGGEPGARDRGALEGALARARGVLRDAVSARDSAADALAAHVRRRRARHVLTEAKAALTRCETDVEAARLSVQREELSINEDRNFEILVDALAAFDERAARVAEAAREAAERARKEREKEEEERYEAILCARAAAVAAHLANKGERRCVVFKGVGFPVRFLVVVHDREKEKDTNEVAYCMVDEEGYVSAHSLCDGAAVVRRGGVAAVGFSDQDQTASRVDFARLDEVVDGLASAENWCSRIFVVPDAAADVQRAHRTFVVARHDADAEAALGEGAVAVYLTACSRYFGPGTTDESAGPGTCRMRLRSTETPWRFSSYTCSKCVRDMSRKMRAARDGEPAEDEEAAAAEGEDHVSVYSTAREVYRAVHEGLDKLYKDGRFRERTYNVVKDLIKGEVLRSMNSAPGAYRWSEDMKRLVLLMFNSSAAAVRDLREFLTVPSARSAQRWRSFERVREGLNFVEVGRLRRAFLKHLQLGVDGLSDEQCGQLARGAAVQVAFDGMSTRRQMRVLPGGKVANFGMERGSIGNEHNVYEVKRDSGGDVHDTEIASELASDVVVYEVRSIATKFRWNLAIFPLASESAARMFRRFWAMVAALASVNLHVVAVACDGCQANRSFVSMCCGDDGVANAPLGKLSAALHCCLNPFLGSASPIFFFFDPGHVAKLLRNFFVDGGGPLPILFSSDAAFGGDGLDSAVTKFAAGAGVSRKGEDKESNMANHEYAPFFMVREGGVPDTAAISWAHFGELLSSQSAYLSGFGDAALRELCTLKWDSVYGQTSFWRMLINPVTNVFCDKTIDYMSHKYVTDLEVNVEACLAGRDAAQMLLDVARHRAAAANYDDNNLNDEVDSIRKALKQCESDTTAAVEQLASAKATVKHAQQLVLIVNFFLGRGVTSQGMSVEEHETARFEECESARKFFVEWESNYAKLFDREVRVIDAQHGVATANTEVQKQHRLVVANEAAYNKARALYETERHHDRMQQQAAQQVRATQPVHQAVEVPRPVLAKLVPGKHARSDEAAASVPPSKRRRAAKPYSLEKLAKAMAAAEEKLARARDALASAKAGQLVALRVEELRRAHVRADGASAADALAKKDLAAVEAGGQSAPSSSAASAAAAAKAASTAEAAAEAAVKAAADREAVENKRLEDGDLEARAQAKAAASVELTGTHRKDMNKRLRCFRPASLETLWCFYVTMRSFGALRTTMTDDDGLAAMVCGRTLVASVVGQQHVEATFGDIRNSRAKVDADQAVDGFSKARSRPMTGASKGNTGERTENIAYSVGATPLRQVRRRQPADLSSVPSVPRSLERARAGGGGGGGGGGGDGGGGGGGGDDDDDDDDDPLPPEPMALADDFDAAAGERGGADEDVAMSSGMADNGESEPAAVSGVVHADERGEANLPGAADGDELAAGAARADAMTNSGGLSTNDDTLRKEVAPGEHWDFLVWGKKDKKGGEEAARSVAVNAAAVAVKRIGIGTHVGEHKMDDRQKGRVVELTWREVYTAGESLYFADGGLDPKSGARVDGPPVRVAEARDVCDDEDDEDEDDAADQRLGGRRRRTVAGVLLDMAEDPYDSRLAALCVDAYAASFQAYLAAHEKSTKSTKRMQSLVVDMHKYACGQVEALAAPEERQAVYFVVLAAQQVAMRDMTVTIVKPSSDPDQQATSSEQERRLVADPHGLSLEGWAVATARSELVADLRRARAGGHRDKRWVGAAVALLAAMSELMFSHRVASRDSGGGAASRDTLVSAARQLEDGAVGGNFDFWGYYNNRGGLSVPSQVLHEKFTGPLRVRLQRLLKNDYLLRNRGATGATDEMMGDVGIERGWQEAVKVAVKVGLEQFAAVKERYAREGNAMPIEKSYLACEEATLRKAAKYVKGALVRKLVNVILNDKVNSIMTRRFIATGKMVQWHTRDLLEKHVKSFQSKSGGGLSSRA